jgi:hypothetical protein
LESLGGFPDGHSVFLCKLDEHAASLCRDRVIMISLLCLWFDFWNFRKHFRMWIKLFF